MKKSFFTLACLIATSPALAQPAPPPPGGPHHPPPADKGAYIRLEQGESSVDLQCPEETSLKDCTDTALRLLDRVASPRRPEPPGR